MKKFTVINNHFRIKHNLSFNECIVADLVFTQTNSKGWYTGGRKLMGKELGLSKVSIINLIATLCEKGIIIRNDETRYLKTTKKWNNEFYR